MRFIVLIFMVSILGDVFGQAIYKEREPTELMLQAEESRRVRTLIDADVADKLYERLDLIDSLNVANTEIQRLKDRIDAIGGGDVLKSVLSQIPKEDSYHFQRLYVGKKNEREVIQVMFDAETYDIYRVNYSSYDPTGYYHKKIRDGFILAYFAPWAYSGIRYDSFDNPWTDVASGGELVAELEEFKAGETHISEFYGEMPWLEKIVNEILESPGKKRKYAEGYITAFKGIYFIPSYGHYKSPGFYFDFETDPAYGNEFDDKVYIDTRRKRREYNPDTGLWDKEVWKHWGQIHCGNGSCGMINFELGGEVLHGEIQDPGGDDEPRKEYYNISVLEVEKEIFPYIEDFLNSWGLKFDYTLYNK